MSKDIAKQYVVLDDGRIGYIDHVCMCEQCKKRGCAEIFINNLTGEYLDCIKSNEIYEIAYCGYSLCDADNLSAKIIADKRKRHGMEDV